VYIPEASITLPSFIRAKLLNIFTRKKIIILSFQPRQYNVLTRRLIKLIKPESVVTQSKETATALNKIDIPCKVLPLGVDDVKYSDQGLERKRALRQQYNIGENKTVLIHVGHIRSSRNLEYLSQLKKRLPNLEIITIGSTYNPGEKKLYKTLIDHGIVVFNNYIPDIENLYNLADYYIFPVIKKDAAIETPLSVLEAMACNLRVITTRFGSLPEMFKEDEFFHYIGSVEDIINVLKSDRSAMCQNRKKTEPFTWSQVTSRLINLIE